MPKAYTPKVITANHLLEGDVIYLTDTGWTRNLAEAEVLSDEAHAELRLIEASQQKSQVVGVYLADVAITDDGPDAVHFREEFRKTGPSNYFHGKQAQGASHV